MKHYNKSDVEFHSESYYGRGYPAVNVKVHSLYHLASKIENHFNCSEEQAQKALDYAFEMSCDLFWNEYAQDFATEILGDVKIHSAGRSNGWLIVEGLPDFESWNAIDLAKWRSFENHIKAEVKYLTSWENVKEDIESNRWAEEGAEKYNFYEKADGESFCFVDWKQEQLEKVGAHNIKLIKACEW